MQVSLRHMPKDTQLLSMLTLSFVTNVHSLQLYSTEKKNKRTHLVSTSGNTRYYTLTEQKKCFIQYTGKKTADFNFSPKIKFSTASINSRKVEKLNSKSCEN